VDKYGVVEGSPVVKLLNRAEKENIARIIISYAPRTVEDMPRPDTGGTLCKDFFVSQSEEMGFIPLLPSSIHNLVDCSDALEISLAGHLIASSAVQ